MRGISFTIWRTNLNEDAYYLRLKVNHFYTLIFSEMPTLMNMRYTYNAEIKLEADGGVVKSALSK